MKPELVNCHTHTIFSDGKSTLEENMRAATQAGLTTVACTDHWGRPSWVDCSIKEAQLDEYAQAIAQARRQFPKLQIIHGLEADWYEGCAGDIADTRGQATFLLGSVHYLRTLPLDWDENTHIWEEMGADELWGLYASEWCKAATSGIFDCMAHPDLPRLMSTKGHAPTRAMGPLYNLMAEAAHEGRVHVEINTAGLTKGFNDFYPCADLLTRFFKAEVPVAVGTDAHHFSRISANIRDAYAYAGRIGYTSIDVPTPDGDWRTIRLDNC